MNKEYKGLATGIFVAGLVAVIAGASNPNEVWSIWLTSLGSAAAGASIGSFFLRLSAEDLSNDVKEALKQSVRSRFLSEEKFTDEYKKKWYHYNVSQNNGKFSWKCAFLDYSNCPIEGGMSASIKFADKLNQIHKYRVESAFRGERLISFFHTPTGLESIAAEIIPFLGHAFKDYYAGISFMQTWDGNHSLIPILMSETPLFGVRSEGFIPEELYDKFDDAWIKGMDEAGPIFPMPSLQRGIDLRNT